VNEKYGKIRLVRIVSNNFLQASSKFSRFFKLPLVGPKILCFGKY
jgi:hypothetical protein